MKRRRQPSIYGRQHRHVNRRLSIADNRRFTYIPYVRTGRGAIPQEKTMKTVDFLDAIKARHNLTSDYAAAAKLGVTRQMVSAYRAGKTFGDDMALKTAELLDMPPGYVLACVHAERTADAATRKVWDSIARTMKAAGKATAGVAFAAMLAHQGDTRAALAIQKGAAHVTNCTPLYIMSTAVHTTTSWLE